MEILLRARGFRSVTASSRMLEAGDPRAHGTEHRWPRLSRDVRPTVST
jgi:hypothetical protein